MEDILLEKKCKKCGANITLMTSCRGKDDEVLTNSYLVERCLNCGQHPITEIARLDANQTDLPMEQYFKAQVKKNKIITSELLPKLKGKSLYSEYQIGDILLTFMSMNPIIKKGDNEVEISMLAVVERDLKQLEKDFIFVRIQDSIPILTRRRK